MNDREHDLHALRTVIEEARNVIMTSGLPQERTRRAMSLLTSALALTDNLISNAPESIGSVPKDRRKDSRGVQHRPRCATARARRGGRQVRGRCVLPLGIREHNYDDVRVSYERSIRSRRPERAGGI